MLHSILEIMRFTKNIALLPLIILIIVIVFITWAGSVFLFPDDDDFEPDQTISVVTTEPQAELSAPHNAMIPEETATEEVSEDVVINAVVEAGDTAGKILQPYLSSAAIQAMDDACAGIFSLRRLRVGQPYVIILRGETFSEFIYEIDNDKKLIVEQDGNTFAVKLEDIEYDVNVHRIQGTITSHLFQAVADAGETPALAIAMANILAWEINFIRDLRPDDSFSLLVEKRYRNGEFKGYGRIFGVSFVNQGTVYEAFLFKDAEGFPHYYTGKGESVKRAFLKAPLSFTRISSTFSPKRLHPILKVWRAHPGIDYAAPKGTPVKAVGNGVVTFKGWGKGAGNYITLRHNNNFETMYLHLSGFAKALTKGKKVQQGEVIGFVGSTGYSTGPHLDFRMKKDGEYVNPLNMVSPRTEPVSEKDMPEFSQWTATMREFLEGHRDITDFSDNIAFPT